MVRERRIALVTGANRGIGRHVAQQLAEAGMTVLAGSRGADRGKATAGDVPGDVRLAVIDVTDQRTVDAVAKRVAEEFGRLDVLVNNAAIAPDPRPPSEVDLDALRQTYETNVFGVIRVTNAFMPLLRRSGAPRIVNVSSGLGSFDVMTRSTGDLSQFNAAAYQTSKVALNAVTVLYAKELRDTPFKVNAISPVAMEAGIDCGCRCVLTALADQVHDQCR